MDEGMLSFRSYLLENESQKLIGTIIKGIATRHGHYLGPETPVTVTKTKRVPGFVGSHTVRYVHQGKSYTTPVREDNVSLSSDTYTKATKEEKEIVRHLQKTLAGASLDTIPANIRPHVTALHNEIMTHVGSASKISKTSDFTGPSTLKAKIDKLSTDRGKEIHPEDHHLVSGTDLAVHTEDGHAHYFDLKIPSTSGAYSLPSPGIHHFMEMIKSVHPDYIGHKKYVEDMSTAETPKAMAELTMNRIGAMGDGEKTQLYSKLLQQTTQKGTGYTVTRIVHQKKKSINPTKSTKLGQGIQNGNVNVSYDKGRNIKIDHPSEPGLTISMRIDRKTKRATIRPPRKKNSERKES